MGARTIRDYIAVAEKVPESVKAKIRQTPLENETRELIALS